MRKNRKAFQVKLKGFFLAPHTDTLVKDLVEDLERIANLETLSFLNGPENDTARNIFRQLLIR
jgi:hypothetical protein